MASIIPVTQLFAQAQQGVNMRGEEERRVETFGRERAAYNALRQTYGDIAGDPVAANQMQTYGHNEVMNPLRVEQQQLTNSGMADQNNYLREAYPLQLENKRLGNEGAVLSNEGASIVNDGRLTDNAQASRDLREDESKDMRAALLQGAGFVKQQMEQGADPGAAFDQVAPYLPLSPEQAAQVRETLVANPQELDAFIEQLQGGDAGEVSEGGLQPVYGTDEAGNYVMGQVTKDGQFRKLKLPPGVAGTPKTTIKDFGDRAAVLGPDGRLLGVFAKGGDPSADQRPVYDETGKVVGLEAIPNSTLDVKRTEEAEAKANAELAAEAAAGRISAPVLRSFTRALDDYLPQVTQGEGIAGSSIRAGKALVWGTPEYKIMSEVVTPLANISLEQLKSMRESSATGASGLGQVTQTEHQMLKDSIAAIDLSREPAVLEENLKQLHNTFLDIIYGSPDQRAAAVKKGKMDPELAASVENHYYVTEFDKLGRRNAAPDQSTGDSEFGDMSTEDMWREIVGGN